MGNCLPRAAQSAKGLALALLVAACQTNPNNPDPVSDPGCLAALNVYNETAAYYVREADLGNMDEARWNEADAILVRLDTAVVEECGEDAE